MMLCDRCDKQTHIIHITEKHEKICDECNNKQRITNINNKVEHKTVGRGNYPYCGGDYRSSYG